MSGFKQIGINFDVTSSGSGFQAAAAGFHDVAQATSALDREIEKLRVDYFELKQEVQEGGFLGPGKAHTLDMLREEIELLKNRQRILREDALTPHEAGQLGMPAGGPSSGGGHGFTLDRRHSLMLSGVAPDLLAGLAGAETTAGKLHHALYGLAFVASSSGTAGAIGIGALIAAMGSVIGLINETEKKYKELNDGELKRLAESTDDYKKKIEGINEAGKSNVILESYKEQTKELEKHRDILKEMEAIDIRRLGREGKIAEQEYALHLAGIDNSDMSPTFKAQARQGALSRLHAAQQGSEQKVFGRKIQTIDQEKASNISGVEMVEGQARDAGARARAAAELESLTSQRGELQSYGPKIDAEIAKQVDLLMMQGAQEGGGNIYTRATAEKEVRERFNASGVGIQGNGPGADGKIPTLTVYPDQVASGLSDIRSRISGIHDTHGRLQDAKREDAAYQDRLSAARKAREDLLEKNRKLDFDRSQTAASAGYSQDDYGAQQQLDAVHGVGAYHDAASQERQHAVADLGHATNQLAKNEQSFTKDVDAQKQKILDIAHAAIDSASKGTDAQKTAANALSKVVSEFERSGATNAAQYKRLADQLSKMARDANQSAASTTSILQIEADNGRRLIATQEMMLQQLHQQRDQIRELEARVHQ